MYCIFCIILPSLRFILFSNFNLFDFIAFIRNAAHVFVKVLPIIISYFAKLCVMDNFVERIETFSVTCIYTHKRY